MNIPGAIHEHIDYLANHSGCRMIGTPGNLAAADYIAFSAEEYGP